jgi:hypothetical protein
MTSNFWIADSHGMNTLDEESSTATALLAGKTVTHVIRHRPNEMLVEFSDGTRLYVDATDGRLELSVTERR